VTSSELDSYRLPRVRGVFATSLVSAFKPTALLLSVQVLPPLMLYVGADSSMAIGSAAAALVILIVYFLTQTTSRNSGRHVEIGPFAIAAAVTLLAVPHAAVADFFQPTDVARLIKTLPLLFLFLSSGIAMGRILLKETDATMKRAIALSFTFLCVCVIFRVLGVQPRADALEKPIFPFTEPSHFALAFAPMLLYRCVQSTGIRRSSWLLLGFGIALAVQSLTLIIACLVAAMSCRRIYLVLLIGLALAVGLVLTVGTLPFEFDYFTSRLDITGDVRNLSNLVYIQGWQILLESLSRSFGWGVGFEQLGIRGTNVEAANAIVSSVGSGGWNVMDGSFVFAKLAGELGLLGAALGVLFLIAAVRSVKVLRSIAARRGKHERTVITFSRCVLVSFTVDMFVRGTGYFTASTLLAVVAVGILVNNKGPLSLLVRAHNARRPIPA